MKFNVDKIEEIIDSYSPKEKKEIDEILNRFKGTKLSLDSEDIKNLVKSVTIYLDFDDVIVDLISPWVDNINKKQGTSYKSSDVSVFDWFSGIKGGFDFLENEDLYQMKNEKGEDIIKIQNDVIPFFKELKRNGMLENLQIVTATYFKTFVSKKKFIQEHLSDYINEKTMVTTNSKFSLDFNNRILIDDRSHNVEDTVITNPYAYAFLLSKPHNKQLYTGNRIKRINSLKEVLYYLPLTVLRSYDRQMNPEKQHLRKETFLNKNQKKKFLAQVENIKKELKKIKEVDYINESSPLSFP